MRKIDQDIFAGDPRIGNCLQAAVASILNKDLEDVPHFLLNGEPNWYRKMLDWLEANGYGLVEVEKWIYQSGIPLIAVGKSPRGVYHSVIYKDGEMIHDPHPSRDGIEKPEWYYIIFPVIDEPTLADPPAKILNVREGYLSPRRSNSLSIRTSICLA